MSTPKIFFKTAEKARRIRNMNFRRLIYPFLDMFFPAVCHGCEGELKQSRVPFFCDSCWSGIQPIASSCCPQCGKPFSSSWALSFSPGHRCGDCRSYPPFFDRIVTPYPFDGVLAKGIFLYKYHRKTSLISHLVRLSSPFLNSMENIDFIVPVPLHKDRLKEREFNQSLLLGDALGKVLDKPVLGDLLKKVRPTDLQMRLSRSDRRKNLKKSINLAGSKKIKGSAVLLVDDVFTTGSTMNECARVLKKEGCREVVGFAVARTLLKSIGY